MNGPLYDDFRIADVKTGDTLYTTKIKSPYEENIYAIYGIDNNFTEALISTNKRKDIIEFLNKKILQINGENY